MSPPLPLLWREQNQSDLLFAPEKTAGRKKMTAWDFELPNSQDVRESHEIKVDINYVWAQGIKYKNGDYSNRLTR